MPLSKRFFDALADSGDVPRAKKARPSPKPGAAVKAMKRAASMAVKRALSRAIEVKSYVYGDYAVVSNAGTSIANIYNLGTGTWPLSPYAGFCEISQGTGEGQRIGNRIKVKKAVIDMMVNPAQYNSTTNPTPTPCILKMWIYRLKAVSNATEVQNAISGYFKQSNNGDLGLAGTYADLLLPDNEDAIQILHTQEWKVGFSQNGGTGGQAGYQTKCNNDFKMCVRIKKDITKFLYAAYDFNDTTTTPLNQSATWMTIEMVPYDGTITNIGSGPGEVSMTSRLDFSDA